MQFTCLLDTNSLETNEKYFLQTDFKTGHFSFLWNLFKRYVVFL
ncbi:hypothetical protein DJ91_1016 [Priestia megaterium]|nr:hypothetical protein DJ91_1016 [Priestia megaterium]